MARSALSVVLAVLLLALPGAAADVHFAASGSYLVGHPGTKKIDACGASSDRSTSSLDSSCEALPSGLAWLPFRASAQDEQGEAVEVEVCFYRDGRFLNCGVTLVPPEATHFSVSSVLGVQVSWTFVVETP